jgi:hypothetical protein
MKLPPPVPKPCNDCPWRRVAMRGWLGPHSAAEWLRIAHGEQPIACHQTIRREDWEAEGLRQCAGAAIFRKNVAKLPRWDQDAARQFKPDTETVFASDAEFEEYHK